MPLLVTAIAPTAGVIPRVPGTSLMFLALLGGLAARGRRRSSDGCNTRHVLGCAGHDADCRRRVVVRNGYVNGPTDGWRVMRA
jgi:hypothetical protein